MRFGLFSVVDHYPTELKRSLAEFYAELLEQAETADASGFHSFWVAEHHFHEYGAVPRPSVFLSAVAARTKQIRLGSAVAVLPLDHPLRIAEDYAMLDLISNGRLEFGVGSGYLQHEFDGFNLIEAGADTQLRRQRFDESLDIIRASWSGEKVHYTGQVFQIDGVQLNVVPIQEPEPPIFIAVLRNEVAPFVGKKHLGMMMIPYATTDKIDELKTACDNYKKEYLASGKQKSMEPRIPFGLHCFCAQSTEEARNFARPYMDRYVRTRLYAKQRSFDELIDKDVLAVGDPQEIIRIASLYEKAGLSDFLMIMNFGGMPHEAVLNSIKLIAKEVIPHFAVKALLGSGEHI